MVTFNWLHLTDLHLGMDDEGGLWYEAEDSFFEDLKRIFGGERKILQLRDEPLDLVLFTGDLVYSGKSGQFEKVNEVLERLRRELEQMGQDKDNPPKLLAVPGNHDLVRPPKSTKNNPNLVLDTLVHLWDNEDCPHYRSEFWSNPDSPQRKIVNEAFENYRKWWEDPNLPLPKPEEDCLDGQLPGDFSVTIEKDGARLGIVGLNSTFLQLMGGDRERKLALDRSQFHKACGGNGDKWTKKHNTCLLLTHHPPSWLTEKAHREHLDKSIHRRAGRFALHLFGHKHSLDLTTLPGGDGSSDTRNRLQGRSLFGLEEWERGKEGREEGGGRTRSHGYSFGQLKIDKDQLERTAEGAKGRAELYIWPCKATEEKHWVMNREDDRGLVDADGVAKRSVPIYAIDTASLSSQRIEPSPNGDTSEKGSSGEEENDEDPDLFQRIDPTIDPILLSRLDALQRNLCRLVWLEADFKTLEMRRRERADWSVNLLNKVKEHLKDLERLHDRLDQEEQIDDEAIKNIWHKYAKINEASRNVCGEYLDSIGGLSICDEMPNREISGMQDVADEFIRVCARKYVERPWLEFLTAPARQDAFNKAIVRIVRLRFPQWTIWSLPLAAHEFGHLVIEEHHEELAGFVREQAQKNWGWKPKKDSDPVPEAIANDIYEVLSDTFATYMIGPAYVCAAISLRLDPSAASDNGRLTDDERAEVMFGVLENRMKRAIRLRRATNKVSDDDAGKEPNADLSVPDFLRQEWKNTRQRATSLEEPAGRGLASLAEDASEEVKWVVLRPSGRYLGKSAGGLENAEAWALAWSDELEQPPDGSQELSVPRVLPGSTLRDALNAAWLCRLQRKPGEIKRIAEVAEKLCKKIIEYPTDPPGPGPGRADPSRGPSTPPQ